MKMFIIVMRDITANVYGQPNFVGNLGGAIRTFADQVNDPKRDTVLSQHPEDFELYKVGTYEDNTCEWELHKPEQIATGKNLLRNTQ